jgi:hypothetical protein
MKEKFKALVAQAGYTDSQIAQALGLKTETFKKLLRSYGKTPKWAKSAVLLLEPILKAKEDEKAYAVAQERKAWEQYIKEYKAWAKKYKFEPSMECGMNEPNPPHYVLANND